MGLFGIFGSSGERSPKYECRRSDGKQNYYNCGKAHGPMTSGKPIGKQCDACKRKERKSRGSARQPGAGSSTSSGARGGRGL